MKNLRPGLQLILRQRPKRCVLFVIRQLVFQAWEKLLKFAKPHDRQEAQETHRIESVISCYTFPVFQFEKSELSKIVLRTEVFALW